MKFKIANKKWVLDLNSTSQASLHLNSTYIPEQRIKNENDELNMRNLFKEGDLVCAEINSKNNENSINLHTRSQKYGKLSNGILVRTHGKLIKKQKKHFTKLVNDIYLILGHNGFLWISDREGSQEENVILSLNQKSWKILPETREQMAIVRNILRIMSDESIEITPETLNHLIAFIQENKIPAK